MSTLMFKVHFPCSITNAASITATAVITVDPTTATDATKFYHSTCIAALELHNTKRFETNITFKIRAFIKQLRSLNSFMSHGLFKKRNYLKLT